MNHYLRWILLALAGVLGVLGVGWLYKHTSQKREPVWAEGERAVRWEPTLKVWIDPAFGAHEKSARKAVQRFNEAVGCDLMALVDTRPDDGIAILSAGCPSDSQHAGCTHLDRANGSVKIRVGQPGDVTMSYLIFYHELGHAWGLAHDGVYRAVSDAEKAPVFVSIMATNAAEHAVRLSQGLLLPDLSEKDRKALRERYCR